MLGFNVGRTELAGLIPREEDHAPCLLRIAFEHDVSLIRGYRPEWLSGSQTRLQPTGACLFCSSPSKASRKILALPPNSSFGWSQAPSARSSQSAQSRPKTSIPHFRLPMAG